MYFLVCVCVGFAGVIGVLGLGFLYLLGNEMTCNLVLFSWVVNS